MKSIHKAGFILVVVIILTIILFNCKKDDQQNKIQYDLFPLKVGNEFYFRHSHGYTRYIDGYDTIGTEKWTVMSNSTKNNNIEYSIEKKFNGFFVKWCSLCGNGQNYFPPLRDSTIIVEEGHFTITQKPSGDLLFWSITIPRYYSKPDTIISLKWASDWGESYTFKAEKGLTSYTFSGGLTSFNYHRKYILDSVRISK
jgi:hypothetical protein